MSSGSATVIISVEWGAMRISGPRFRRRVFHSSCASTSFVNEAQELTLEIGVQIDVRFVNEKKCALIGLKQVSQHLAPHLKSKPIEQLNWDRNFSGV